MKREKTKLILGTTKLKENRCKIWLIHSKHSMPITNKGSNMGIMNVARVKGNKIIVTIGTTIILFKMVSKLIS